MRSAAALEADLHHTFVLVGGFDHGAAFADIGADGLLAVDVSAGLGGFEQDEGMPVIGRGD